MEVAIKLVVLKGRVRGRNKRRIGVGEVVMLLTVLEGGARTSVAEVAIKLAVLEGRLKGRSKSSIGMVEEVMLVLVLEGVGGGRRGQGQKRV